MRVLAGIVAPLVSSTALSLKALTFAPVMISTPRIEILCWA
jgi:hypothetical protein